MRFLLVVPVVLAISAAACSPDRPDDVVIGGPVRDSLALVARPIAADLDAPVHVATPAGDPRVFIVEQVGRIRVMRGAALLDRPFLDIRRRVRAGGERGLLSVAFHPLYATNGWLYVNYTDQQGHTNIERYTVSADPDSADPASAHRILFVEQPYANHNGGLVAFGPDGMLYVGMGDGGSGGDPDGHGQNLDSALGKLLRLDVDAGDPFAVPTDNPWATEAGARALVWAYGVRNPWRFSWDDGRIYVADVGQNRWEEINVESASAAGLDYGWNVMEGSHCFSPSIGCSRGDRVIPVVEYEHDDGACSVTGGHVYRGAAIPELHGHYFYSDWCSGWIRSFRVSAEGDVTDHRVWDVGAIEQVTSFGVDAAGELYVTSGMGQVYRLELGASGS
jgi:glucose/arabinose dehydrogenase